MNSFITTTEFNDNFETNFGVLVEIIRKYSLVVSGSSVIATIFQTSFDNSDIDVYTCQNFSLTNGKVNSALDDEIVTQLGGVLVLSAPYHSIGKINYKYICPAFTINIINVNVRYKFELYDHIYRSTDLDICASTYNGYEVRYPKNLLEMTANSVNQNLIYEIDKIIFAESVDRESEIQRMKDIFILKRTTRIVKYSERGFEISSDITVSESDRFRAMNFMLKQANSERMLYQMICNVVMFYIQNSKQKLFGIIKSDKLFSERIRTGENIFAIKFKGHNNDEFNELNFPWITAWINYMTS